MPNGSLTLQERKVLDQLAATCKKHGPRLPLQTQQMCALLKNQQELDNQRKEAELRNAAQHQLNDRRMQALAYVTRTINARQTEGLLLVGALIKASGDYDQILAARAAKPIALEIMLTLALTALPEIKLLGRAVKAFVPKNSASWKAIIKDANNVTQYAWKGLVDQFGRTIQKAGAPAANVMGAVSTFAASLDNQAKDIIEAIRDPLKASADIDQETRQRFATHQAKNQVLAGVINDIQRSLAAGVLAERITHTFIFWYNGEDVKEVVQADFEENELGDDRPYSATSFDRFSDLILYDMLRTYVRSYFVVTRVKWHRGASVARVDEQIDGLDVAQRKLIYDRFGKVPWNNRDRPPVKDDTDLMNLWGGKLVESDDYLETGNRI